MLERLLLERRRRLRGRGRLRRLRQLMTVLPNLGVGLSFRSVFRGDLFANRDRVDFLEIIADHYFDAPREKLDELDLLADHFPIVPHGLDLSLGSADGVDARYLDKFAALPVPRITENLSASESVDAVKPGLTFAVWLRAPGGRLRHWRRTLP